MGWEILLPARVTATWNGGAELADLTVEVDDFGGESHPCTFAFWVRNLTFSSGYLFRTDPGIALWVRGIPNQPKDGIAPLDGLVETDWLDFTFTMNWQFTRPGSITFKRMSLSASLLQSPITHSTMSYQRSSQSPKTVDLGSKYRSK